MKKHFPSLFIIILIGLLLKAFVATGNAKPAFSTTGSDVPIAPPDPGQEYPLVENRLSIQTAQSGSVINLDDFRNDGRFSNIDGTGYAVAILDTGIDLDHPCFGPDLDHNGVADRIVYSYDFADGDADAGDVNGHGSNVSSIVGSNYEYYQGMAPDVNIIHLKVFPNEGYGSFSTIEQALQWTIAHAELYQIVSVNMSLGDKHNYLTAQSLYGLGDELAALTAAGVVVVSAAGNEFYNKNSVPGIMYPAADANSLAVGATYDANIGYVSYGSGAIAYSTAADRIAPFSQRHETLLDLFAPGAAIRGAGKDGGTTIMHGTSQAAPHIAGIVGLMQELANQHLGRLLTVAEVRDLLVSTAVMINDGDDEVDNVMNTGLNFPRVDMMAVGEAIWAMGTPPTNTPVPTNTNTPLPTNTNTPLPTYTNTPLPTNTNTPLPTNTAVPALTNVPVQVSTPTATSEATAIPHTESSEMLYLPMIIHVNP